MGPSTPRRPGTCATRETTPHDTAPSGRPRLSAIVSAWNREDFLPEALASALSQGLDPRRDEVILNSNLPDGAVRRIVGDAPVRVLHNPTAAQGAFYAAAVREAHGEVLAFLDDDDRWAPGRLAAVGDQFAAAPSLAYYHNEQRRISITGAPLGQDPTVVRLSRRRLRAPRVVPGPLRDRGLRKLMELGPVFNLSSTCVRADAVRPYLPYLERMTTNDDGFFFWASILSGGGCALDPVARTDYRVHGENLSRRWNTAEEGSYAGDWPKRAVQSHTVLLEMATASRRDDVRECLELHTAQLQLLRDVADSATTRRRRGEDLLALLRRFSLGHLPMNAGFATMGAAQLVSPALGRFVHARLRK